MPSCAFITGLAGLDISPVERSFLREAQPWGLILFKRNVESPQQVLALVDTFRDIVGWRAPVLVDQEGGRVQRLGPPHWPAYPPGASYGRLYDQAPDHGCRAAFLAARLIAADLSGVGIDVDCLPLADVPVAGADAVIGDRAYGESPEKVTAIAGAIADGLLAGGVLPVLKHIPGHGRATADSHLRLPVVDADRAALEASDFAPFHALRHLPLGMTAHIVFTAIDPAAPATLSPIMIDVIRTAIGFDGLLMSDDIGMGALAGSIGHRARLALAAGCDLVLHCNGRLTEMQEVAGAAPVISGRAASRAKMALAARRPAEPFDIAGARAELVQLMPDQMPAARILT